MQSNAIKRIAWVLFFLCITCCSTIAQQVSIQKEYYQSIYDLDLLCPRQVTWTLHASDIGDVKREPSWRFVDDIDHPLGVACHDDYKHSGYHRGHLCPAKDRSFQICAMRSTFTTSNIAPQLPRLNTGSWLRTEEWCRSAALKYDSICILAMPVWLDRDTVRIGAHRLAVPHAFIKACWHAQTDSVLNVWFIFNK